MFKHLFPKLSSFFAKKLPEWKAVIKGRLFPGDLPIVETDIKKGIKFISELNGSKENEWTYFQYIRSEIKHEHELLMGRVTWFITCQSFLLTVYAISYSNIGVNWFSNILLPLLAITTSFFAYHMIKGATTTIQMWGELRDTLVAAVPEIVNVIIPRWRSTTSSKADGVHIRALWFPKRIPWLFGIAWLAIAVFSYLFPFTLIAP